MPCSTCPLTSEALSPREQEVLMLLAQGRQTAAIAAALGLSVKTVETYYQRLKQKLAVANLNELIVYAVWQSIYAPLAAALPRPAPTHLRLVEMP